VSLWRKSRLLQNRVVYKLKKTIFALLKGKKLQHLPSEETQRAKVIKLLKIIQLYGIEPGADLASLVYKSRAQLGQDLWIAVASTVKRNGTFLEIGGADGFTISNTYLLEKELDWTGVLVEPALVYREELRKNRECLIDFRCCSSKSGQKVEFLETLSPEYSTINEYRFSDTHADDRIRGVKHYLVETVSLNDIFEKYFPSGLVDYISIDTEGSEEDILQSFNFEKYSFRFLSVENAFNKEKSERISKMLIPKGFKKVLQECSEFDDFYEKSAN